MTAENTQETTTREHQLFFDANIFPYPLGTARKIPRTSIYARVALPETSTLEDVAIEVTITLKALGLYLLEADPDTDPGFKDVIKYIAEALHTQNHDATR